MADTKISALTGATTPLAGTEVLPVVQGSTTKQVSVANLTAGRSVSMLQGNATNAFQVTKAGSNDPWVGPFLGLSNVGTGAAERHWAWQISASDEYDLLNYDGTNWNRWFRFTSAGNLTPMAAGKGVNFTANTPKAGMTSQLLNWYEEGTFTPTVTSGGGTITSYNASGTYVKVGKTITVQLTINITNAGSASGNLNFANLPFTSQNVSNYAYAGRSRENNVSGALQDFLIAANSTTGLIFAAALASNQSYSLTATYITA